MIFILLGNNSINSRSQGCICDPELQNGFMIPAKSPHVRSFRWEMKVARVREEAGGRMMVKWVVRRA